MANRWVHGLGAGDIMDGVYDPFRGVTGGAGGGGATGGAGGSSSASGGAGGATNPIGNATGGAGGSSSSTGGAGGYEEQGLWDWLAGLFQLFQPGPDEGVPGGNGTTGGAGTNTTWRTFKLPTIDASALTEKKPVNNTVLYVGLAVGAVLLISLVKK